MIRPEGLTRPKGTAMSRPEMAMPGTGMICKPEGMNRPVGTAMQTKPGTGMIRCKIRPTGTSRPVGTAMQTEPGTDTAPSLQQAYKTRCLAANRCFAIEESQRATWASSLSRPRALQPNRWQRQAPRHAAAPSTGVWRARFYFVRFGQLFKLTKSS